VYFLLVLIKLFSLGMLRLTRYTSKNGSKKNRLFRFNAVTLTQNFRYKGRSPPIIFARIVRQMNAL